MFFTDTFDSVPAGSNLEVTVTGTGAFGISGRHLVDRGTEVLASDLNSQHFPFRTRVDQGETDIVKFDVGFGGAPAEITFDARVVTPAGSIHQQPFTKTVKLSTSNQLLTVKIFALG